MELQEFKTQVTASLEVLITTAKLYTTSTVSDIAEIQGLEFKKLLYKHVAHISESYSFEVYEEALDLLEIPETFITIQEELFQIQWDSI